MYASLLALKQSRIKFPSASLVPAAPPDVEGRLLQRAKILRTEPPDRRDGKPPQDTNRCRKKRPTATGTKKRASVADLHTAY